MRGQKCSKKSCAQRNVQLQFCVKQPSLRRLKKNGEDLCSFIPLFYKPCVNNEQVRLKPVFTLANPIIVQRIHPIIKQEAAPRSHIARRSRGNHKTQPLWR